MKREDVTKVFEGATDEQIKAILDINSADIGNAKSKAESKATTAEQQLADLQQQITQRDADMQALQEKLTSVQADASKLADAQTALSELQTKYTAEQQEWAAKAAKQAYEFAVKESANSLKFTSASAKKSFIADAIAKGLQMDGDKILGFDDFAKAYKESDPQAFVAESPTEQEKPTPQIVAPTGGTQQNVQEGGFNFSFLGVRPKPTN